MTEEMIGKTWINADAAGSVLRLLKDIQSGEITIEAAVRDAELAAKYRQSVRIALCDARHNEKSDPYMAAEEALIESGFSGNEAANLITTLSNAGYEVDDIIDSILLERIDKGQTHSVHENLRDFLNSFKEYHKNSKELAEFEEILRA